MMDDTEFTVRSTKYAVGWLFSIPVANFPIFEHQIDAWLGY